MLLGILILAPNLEAANWCTNSDFNGAYGLIGSRLISGQSPTEFVGVTATTGTGTGGTGTGGTTGGTTTTSTGPFGNVTTFNNSPFATTQVGSVLNATGTTGRFTAVGRVVADGAGNLFANPNADSPQGNLLLVGSYTVRPDCTLTLTLSDPFSTTSGFFGVSKATFEGVIVNDHRTDIAEPSAVESREVNLVQSAPASVIVPPGSTAATLPPVTTTPPGTLAGATGIFTAATLPPVAVIPPGSTGIALAQRFDTGSVIAISMRRMLNNSGCTTGSFAGAYGLVLHGSTLVNSTTGFGNPPPTTGTTTTPTLAGPAGSTNAIRTFSEVRRFVADGAGMFVLDPTGSGNAAQQLLGTYTVSADCTGTATFIEAGATPSTPGPTRPFNFALVQDRQVELSDALATFFVTGTAKPQ